MLGHAADDREHGARPLALERAELGRARDHALLGLLADRAGVDTMTSASSARAAGRVAGVGEHAADQVASRRRSSGSRRSRRRPAAHRAPARAAPWAHASGARFPSGTSRSDIGTVTYHARGHPRRTFAILRRGRTVRRSCRRLGDRLPPGAAAARRDVRPALDRGRHPDRADRDRLAPAVAAALGPPRLRDRAVRAGESPLSRARRARVHPCPRARRDPVARRLRGRGGPPRAGRGGPRRPGPCVARPHRAGRLAQQSRVRCPRRWPRRPRRARPGRRCDRAAAGRAGESSTPAPAR